MPVDLWTSADFVDEVTHWVAAAAAALGASLTGEWEQPHARPWSCAIRFETDRGRLWFKVNGPGTAHEAALVAQIARVVPALVPDLVAVDTDRGWTLMRDAGPVLRSVAPPEELWDRWCALLPAYAEAQLALADHLPALLGTGVADLRPDRMTERLTTLVDELTARPEEDGGLRRADTDRLHALLPAYDAWAVELAASGVPASVNHDDLHSANVCVPDAGATGMRVIDWGDAAISHPFATMLATLNSIAWHAGTELDDPRVARVRDAYLEPFGDLGSHGDRVRWVDLARATGCLGRALSYVQALVGEPRSAQEELEWPVRGWLLETLEVAEPLGR